MLLVLLPTKQGPDLILRLSWLATNLMIWMFRNKAEMIPSIEADIHPARRHHLRDFNIWFQSLHSFANFCSTKGPFSSKKISPKNFHLPFKHMYEATNVIK